MFKCRRPRSHRPPRALQRLSARTVRARACPVTFLMEIARLLGSILFPGLVPPNISSEKSLVVAAPFDGQQQIHPALDTATLRSRSSHRREREAVAMIPCTVQAAICRCGEQRLVHGLRSQSFKSHISSLTPRIVLCSGRL